VKCSCRVRRVTRIKDPLTATEFRIKVNNWAKCETISPFSRTETYLESPEEQGSGPQRLSFGKESLKMRRIKK